MAMNKVEICGVDTSTLPKFTYKESMALLERVKEGDEEARNEFLNGNLRLVLSVIKRFSGRGEPPDDLFQVGCIGLIKALENFDMSHNVRFSTYAVPMIIGEIRRYLRDNSAIRVSRSMRDTAYHALRVRNQLIDETGTEPRLEDIAKALELPVSEIVFALDALADPISLQEPVFRDDGDAVFICDQISDESANCDRWLDNIAIEDGLSSLSDREQRIIKLRFFRGKTQTEVANEIGISQAQVSRLEKSALTRMRKYV